MSKAAFRRILSIVLSVMLIFSTSGVTECLAENVSREEIPAEETVTGEEIKNGEEAGADGETVISDEKPESDGDTVSSDESGEKTEDDSPDGSGPEQDSLSDNTVSGDNVLSENNISANTVSGDDADTVSGDTVSGDDADSVSGDDAESISDNTVSGDSVSEDSAKTVSGDGLPVEVSVSGNEPEIVKGTLATGSFSGNLIGNINVKITIIVRSDTDVTAKFDSNVSGGDPTELDLGGSDSDFFETTLSNGRTVGYYKDYITELEFHNISNIITSGSNGTVFKSMSKLKSVKIDNSLNNIPDYCFLQCSKLENVYGSRVGTIGERAFAACSALKVIDIPPSVRSIGIYAFNNCTSLEQVNIQGDEYTDSQKLVVNDYAFRYCSNLSRVYYAGGSKSSINFNNGNDYFRNAAWTFNTLAGSCGNIGNNVEFTLEKEAYPYKLSFKGSGYVEDYSSSNRPLWYNYRNGIARITIAEGVTGIGDYALSDLVDLRHIYFPDSFVQIGTNGLSGCTSLTGACFSGDEITLFSGAFSGCSGLNYVSFPKYINFYNEKNHFSGCTSFSEIYLDKNTKFSTDGSSYSGKNATQMVDKMKEYWTGNTSGNKSGLKGYYGRKEYAGDGSDSNDLEYIFTPDDGKLLFRSPSLYESKSMASYDSASLYPWYDLKDSIKSVEYRFLSNIGKSAFEGYTGITSVKNTKESKKSGSSSVQVGACSPNVEEYAFKGCTGLTSLDISVGTVGAGAFYGCSNLATLTISCTGTIPPANKEDTTVNAFDQCNKLSTLNLTCTGATGTAFRGKKSLKTLTINAGGDVTLEAFYGCSGLTEVTIINANILQTYCFGNCTGLTTFNTGGAKQTNNVVLFKCDNLTTFTVGKSLKSMERNPINRPASMKTLAVDPSNISFMCVNKRYILTRDKKTLMIGIGSDPVVIPEGVATIGKAAFTNNSFTTVTIPVTVTRVVDRTFLNCNNLSKVIYPSSRNQWDANIHNNIGIHNDPLVALEYSGIQFSFSEGDFANGKLHWEVTNAGKELAISQKTGSTVTAIPDFTSRSAVPWAQFAGSITTINAECITSVGAYAFSGCTQVSNNSITLGNLTKVGNHAFENCNGLTSLDHIQSANLTSIGSYAFANCNNLSGGPGGLTLTGSNITVEPNAFSNCLSLKKFNSGNAKILKEGCLNGCSFLEEVTIGTTCTSISAPLSDCGDSIEKYTVAGGETFAAPDGSCITKGTELVLATNKADIPNSVTTIGAGAFSYLSSMESVTIQNTVTSIEENAFNGCSGLRYVNFIGSEAEWNTLAGNIAAGNDPLKNAEKRFAVQSGDIDVSGGRKLHWDIDNDNKKLTITVTNGTVTEIPSFESADKVPWAASAS